MYRLHAAFIYLVVDFLTNTGRLKIIVTFCEHPVVECHCKERIGWTRSISI